MVWTDEPESESYSEDASTSEPSLLTRGIVAVDGLSASVRHEERPAMAGGSGDCDWPAERFSPLLPVMPRASLTSGG